MSAGPPIPEKGLELALAILEHVARRRDGATAAELVTRLGAPRASVYRAVGTLTREGYLVRRPDLAGFLLGRRVLELASIVSEHRRSPVDPLLDEVRRETGEAVHLFAFTADGLDVVGEDPALPVAHSEVLFQDPARSAAGHLWLAAHAGPGAWDALPPASDRAAIVASVGARGHAEQFGAVLPSVGCIAVAVEVDGRAVGALALSSDIARMGTAARHLPALRSAAAAVASVRGA